jgi:hypothetical protein
MDVSDRKPERRVKEDRHRVIERMLEKVSIYYKTFEMGMPFKAFSNSFNRKLSTYGEGQDFYATISQLQRDGSLQIVMDANTGARKVYPWDVDLTGKLKPYERLTKP